MNMIGDLFSVERALPEGVLYGLLSGQYSLHGGVIRDAGGQIIRHLIPAAESALNPFGFIDSLPGLFNTYQLHNLTMMTEQLLAISTATMAMSGLGLAVSTLGFATLHGSLNRVEKTLKDMDQKLDWIKNFLDSERRARFLSALQDLDHLTADTHRREHILLSSREKFGEIAFHYLEQWKLTTDVMESMSFQHYYCVAFLAQAKCSAELEMYDTAIKEFQIGLNNWQNNSRTFIKNNFFQEQRSRFLLSSYSEIAPIAKIAGWMDFVYEEPRGYNWLDELRQEFNPESSIFSFLSWWDRENEAKRRRNEIAILDNFTQRNNVLQGFETQFRYFADHKIRPSSLEQAIKPLLDNYADQDVLILASA